jgi:uncharacterized protein (TIGR02996 family)
VTAAPPVTIPAYLVNAMRANPADDGLRLQCADWFDENGQAERAEFVRLQVESGRQSMGNRWHLQRDLADALSHSSFGLAGLAGGPSMQTFCRRDIYQTATSVPRAFFAGGFLESVTCTAADWLAHGDAIYAREPVTAVTLTTWPALYTYRKPGQITYTVTLDVNDAVGYLIQHDVVTRSAGERALADRWPGVKFALPPELRAGIQLRAGILMGQVTAEGEFEVTPPDHGTVDWDAAESMSAAPPDSARRRGGHSRMPGWLAERRSRPGRR